MTQPSFVPIAEADQVRAALTLSVPDAWVPNRPAELRTPVRPTGRGRGTPGPDQGYAIRMARRLEAELVLTPGESVEDVVLGSALLASRRAGLFGRAPTIYDVRLALALFGFLGEASDDLVVARKGRFRSVSHEYDQQRRLVDSVPEETLRLTPDEVDAAAEARGWRSLLGSHEATPTN